MLKFCDYAENNSTAINREYPVAVGLWLLHGSFEDGGNAFRAEVTAATGTQRQ